MAYLYQPYSYAHRYYKVVTLVQKLVLLMIQLFVPPQIIANLKMIMGSIFVMVGASLASLQQPFSDSMESMMEMSSQITNAINILVGLGIASGIPWLQDWVGNALLFTVNGINISVFLTTLVISPIRNILFAKKFAQMQLQLQARKIEEFTKRQAFIAAQKSGNTFDAIRRSSAVRAAAGIASDAGTGVNDFVNGVPGAMDVAGKTGLDAMNTVRGGVGDGIASVRGAVGDGIESAKGAYNSAEAMAVRGADVASKMGEDVANGARQGLNSAMDATNKFGTAALEKGEELGNQALSEGQKLGTQALAEGQKLGAEGQKLGNQALMEGQKLGAQGLAEGQKLGAEGQKLGIQAFGEGQKLSQQAYDGASKTFGGANQAYNSEGGQQVR